MPYLGWFFLEIRTFYSDFARVDVTFDLLDIVKYKLSDLFAQAERPNYHFFDFYLQELARNNYIRTSSKNVDGAGFIDLVDQVIN